MDRMLRELAGSAEMLGAFLTPDMSRIGEPDVVVRFLLQVLLLIGSAYFSGSETALFSLSRLDLQKLRRERNRHSDALHELLDHPRRLIISILCGNELVNVAEEVVGEIDVGYDFDEYLPRRRVYEMLDEEVYLMDSRLPISEVNDALRINLPLKESHTIGGLVMTRLRRIPARGEASWSRATASRWKRHRIAVLKLHVAPAGAGTATPGRR